MENFGTIVKIILLVMKWADSMFSYLHDQGLIKEGEDRAIALAALKVLARSKRAKEIEDTYMKMPADKVRAELEKEGDFRE